jgi:hypothetical protein
MKKLLTVVLIICFNSFYGQHNIENDSLVTDSILSDSLAVKKLVTWKA